MLMVLLGVMVLVPIVWVAIAFVFAWGSYKSFRGAWGVEQRGRATCGLEMVDW